MTRGACSPYGFHYSPEYLKQMAFLKALSAIRQLVPHPESGRRGELGRGGRQGRRSAFPDHTRQPGTDRPHQPPVMPVLLPGTLRKPARRQRKIEETSPRHVANGSNA